MRWYDVRHPDTAEMIACLLCVLSVFHLLVGHEWVAFGMTICFTVISVWLWRNRARIEERVHDSGQAGYQARKPVDWRKYLLNNVIAFDIQINCLLGGRVRTISERIGDLKHHGRLGQRKFTLERLVDSFILEPIDPGHSVRVYLSNKKESV